MGDPDLSAELRRRAESSASAMIREAEAEARRISVEARDSMRKHERDVLRDREDAWRDQVRVRIAGARHEAMKDVLLARTRVVERVLQAAKDLLPGALSLGSYRALLSEDIEQALSFVGSGPATFRCTPALASTIRDELRSKPSVAVEPSDGIGSGFIAADEKHTVSIDCTLETRLARLAPQLAIEIHRRLEEPES